MAAKIPEETINQIRKESNIVDVVSQYVQLKKRGKNYFGYCPFHDEKTPSFSVTDEKQIFHCFSCGRGGNVFTFLMEIEGINFLESVKKAAELSSVDVHINLEGRSSDSPLQNKKEKLIDIHEKISAFYHQVLMNTVTGEKALEYLKKRGFTEALMEEYQIGFSPSDKTTSYQILKKEKFSDELLQETGIFNSYKEDSELLDRFSSRIIFPLRNEKGKVIAFSGRILPNEEESDNNFHEAKYLNSPETILFSKRDFLFNFDKARPEMRKSSEVILFEGYMDVIAAWNAGIKNGVASMGTALTNEQIRMLNKVVDSIVLAYDGDHAGLDATQKAIELLGKDSRFDISVFPLQDNMDPDEYIQEKGDQLFRKALKDQRETVFHFQSRYLRSKIDLSSENNRIRYLDEVLNKLVQVESLVERELYINELANEFSLDPATLKKQLQDNQRDYMKNQKEERKNSPSSVTKTLLTIPAKRKYSQSEISERQLLYRLFHHEEAWNYLEEISSDFHFQKEEYQTIYLLYASFHEETREVGHIDHFLDRIHDTDLANHISSIEMLQLQSEVTQQEVIDLVDIISSKGNWEVLLQQKKKEMKEATRNHNSEEAKRLLMDIVSLSQKIKITRK